MYLIPPTRSFSECHISEAVSGHRRNGGSSSTKDHNAAGLNRVKISACLVAYFCLRHADHDHLDDKRESMLTLSAPLSDPDHAMHSPRSRDGANSPPAKMDQQQSQSFALMCWHDQDDGW
jgi:hypothetical protein